VDKKAVQLFCPQSKISKSIIKGENMKKRIIVSLLSLCNAIYGFIVFWILPAVLVIAFNKTKGAGNNPDGWVMAPIGWFLIVLFPALFFLVNAIVTKKMNFSKKFFVITALCFIVGAIAAIIITNANYSLNYTNILKEIGLIS
jgi:hypothetical protein